MKYLAILVLPLSLAGVWHRVTQATNSHAANARGVKSYAARQYANSANAFSVANSIDPTPANAFNLGTAQIAAGQQEQGSATLGAALTDPRLRAAVFYNRGNSALAANAYENAIRDYSESLRLRPSDADAKRNLEIAYLRKRQAEQSQSGQQRNPSGTQPNRQQRPQAQGGMEKKQSSGNEQNPDALLRAVQEQEQEELNRMKRAKAERKRIGW